MSFMEPYIQFGQWLRVEHDHTDFVPAELVDIPMPDGLEMPTNEEVSYDWLVEKLSERHHFVARTNEQEKWVCNEALEAWDAIWCVVKDYIECYNASSFQSVELIEGWGARLSAPGYLDRTDWSVYETRDEAEAELRELYPEAFPCELCGEDDYNNHECRVTDIIGNMSKGRCVEVLVLGSPHYGEKGVEKILTEEYEKEKVDALRERVEKLVREGQIDTDDLMEEPLNIAEKGYEHTHTWESGEPDNFYLYLYNTDRVREDGKTVLAYEFYHGDNLVFEGEDFSCPPTVSIDSNTTLASLLMFLALKPGDTDSDYFDNYTQEQLDWAQTHGETLWQYAHELESDKDGMS